MAAVTGLSTLYPRPARRKVGARVRSLPEFSALTHPIGALLIRTAGSFKTGVTGIDQSTGILGFAISTGQNLATTTVSGQAKAAYWAAQQDEAYQFVLNTTWTGSALRGKTACLSMNTAGQVFVATAAGSTCGTILDAKDWDNGLKVQDGDVYPVVYFVLADAAIATT